MRTMLGVTIGAVLALTAGGALADEATGTISNIDLNRNTFQLKDSAQAGDYTFTASPTNTVGAKLSELQEGDKVTIEYVVDPGQQKQPINVMILKKTE